MSAFFIESPYFACSYRLLKLDMVSFSVAVALEVLPLALPLPMMPMPGAIAK